MSRALFAAYRRGMEAAEIARAVAAFSHKRVRPPAELRALSKGVVTVRVRQWVRWTAEGAGGENVSKRALRELVGDLRDMATNERLEIVQLPATTAAARQTRDTAVRDITSELRRAKKRAAKKNPAAKKKARK